MKDWIFFGTYWVIWWIWLMDKGNYAMILSAFHGSSKELILEVHETHLRLLVIDDFDIVETSAPLIFLLRSFIEITSIFSSAFHWFMRYYKKSSFRGPSFNWTPVSGFRQGSMDRLVRIGPQFSTFCLSWPVRGLNFFADAWPIGFDPWLQV